MARGSLKINLLALFNNKGVREAQKDLRSLGRSVESLGGAALKASAAFAAFSVGRGLVDFASQATSEASDLVRNLNGLEAVFQELTPGMREFVDQAYLMGLSQNEAAKATTFLGSVLKQSGFDMQTVSKLTKELVALGTDLSITYGYDVQEALLGMTALFRGEYDPIEKFGVAMKQSEIDAERLARGLGNATGAQQRFIDQLIRVEFLFERAQDAVGNFQAQVGTLFVEQQILEAQIRNLAAEVGGPLLQAFGQLIQAFRPLIIELAPVLTGMFAQMIIVVRSLVENKEDIIQKFKEFAGAVSVVVRLLVGATLFVVEHIGAISRLVVAMGIYFATVKTIAVVTTIWQGVAAGAALAAKAVGLLNISLNLTATAIRGIKFALVSTGVGAALVGLGLAAEFVMGKFDKGADGLMDFGNSLNSTQADIDKLMESLDSERIEGFNQATLAEIKKLTSEAVFSGQDLFGPGGSAGAGAAARDGVRTFYSNLADEAEKQKAKLRLEQLGATPALIESILGSGDQWRSVFNSVVANGVASVQAVQELFRATTAGYQEAMAKWEEEVLNPFKEFKREAEAARDSFIEFIGSFRILPSIESSLGRFESAAVQLLESVEGKLDDAFDNGYLLEESYRNLQEYARNELATLRQIEAQRDQIIARRDAAARLIEQVQNSVRASGNLVTLLREIQQEAGQVDILRFTRQALTASGTLRDFSVALITNFVDPIHKARNESDKLVQGFRGVVERTREYVENLKILQALGLDPMLFNQLVEAGVEAGGETAKALIEGGADTITEINSLFKELDRLGAELGENTAQVMYGQGEKFVDGIVNGLAAQASELEATANALAESFTTTFEAVLIAGIEAAIAAAEAALARMPQAPGFDWQPSVPTGPDGPQQIQTPGRVTPGPTPPLADTAFNALQSLANSARQAAQTAPALLRGVPTGVQTNQLNPFAQAGSNAFTGLSRTPAAQVTVFTSASPSAVANSIARYNTTNTSRDVTGSINLRSLKSK